MRRPLIGLTGRRKTAAQIVGTPESLSGLEGDWYYADYARGVLAAGGLPVNLPLDADPSDYRDHLDAIVLSGGADIDPGRYDAPSETDEYPPEPERDEQEFRLLAEAMDAGLPVLGICRGLQLINVACGGSLHQHVPAHAAFDQQPDTLLHDLTIEPDSHLAAFFGTTLRTNSLHHQTVDRVGANLRVTARADDGTVEGLEHATLPVLAVQWHPEMLPTRDGDPLFGWLVDAAIAARS